MNIKPMIILFLSISTLFANFAFAKCPDVNIDYAFVTKAQNGEEADKAPKYVPSEGGYLPDENVSCRARKINFSFLGAHYAQDRGAGIVRIEVYDNQQKKLGEKTIQVAEWIRSWQDVSNTARRRSYSGRIELPQQSDISKIRIFVIPGNWAVIINDLKITFSQK
jgi:hypothetical protein